MASQMIVRIDPVLKRKVSRFAQAEGRNVSEIVRELLENYVKSRDIAPYIDDLWNRIAAKMGEEGFSAEDIAPAIRDLRAGK